MSYPKPVVAIDPELRRVALEASELLITAAAIGDVADLFGGALRGKASEPIADALAQISAELRQSARDMVRAYTSTITQENV